jgi:hypothetical protein
MPWRRTSCLAPSSKCVSSVCWYSTVESLPAFHVQYVSYQVHMFTDERLSLDGPVNDGYMLQAKKSKTFQLHIQYVLMYIQYYSTRYILYVVCVPARARKKQTREVITGHCDLNSRMKIHKSNTHTQKKNQGQTSTKTVSCSALLSS